uniref:Uncharacterized protein n=1 Tax=Anopheles maculatus TaxID=74869 RepID=A0A182TAH9_9DIPT
MSESKGDAFRGPSPFEQRAPPKRNTRSALKASSLEVPQTGEKAAATTSAAPATNQNTPPLEKDPKKPRVQLEGLSLAQIEGLLPSDDESDFSYDDDDEYEKLAKDYDNLLVEMAVVERRAQKYILENADLHRKLKEITERLETATRNIDRLQTRVEEVLQRENSPSVVSRATQTPPTSALPPAAAPKQTIVEPTSSAVEVAEKWSDVVRRKPAKKKEAPASALPIQHQRQNKQSSKK